MMQCVSRSKVIFISQFAYFYESRGYDVFWYRSNCIFKTP
jgi:hypothetical protein